jgi:hypothetical protein
MASKNVLGMLSGCEEEDFQRHDGAALGRGHRRPAADARGLYELG